MLGTSPRLIFLSTVAGQLRYALRMLPEGHWQAARKLAPWLWVLLGLFCLRVAGQMLVAFWGVNFLPAMEVWYSGLIPYGPLLVSQFLISLLYGKVCVDFTRGRGYFAMPGRRFGTRLLVFGWLYLGAMVLRNVIRMGLYPEERWFGGTIPIFFHWVLAAFILLVGNYHRRESEPSS